MSDTELPPNAALHSAEPENDTVNDSGSLQQGQYDKRSPLEHLSHLSSLTIGDSAMAAPRETARNWRGFAFRAGDLDMVFPFMGGFEILPEREIQTIPWAVDWVRGITNVRGEIYSVVDFPAYLGLGSVSSIRNATVFLLPDTTVRSALLIAERVTLRSYSEFLPQLSEPEVPAKLNEFLSTVLVDDGRQWHVLDAARLIASRSFLDIAA